MGSIAPSETVVNPVLSMAMGTSKLRFTLTGLDGAPVEGPFTVTLRPAGNTGGTPLEAAFDQPGETDFTVTGLNAIPYAVRIESRNYRLYSFFSNANPGAIRLAIRPGRVKGILAPAVRPDLTAILPAVGFFDTLDALRQACLLNIFAKARHVSTAGSFRFVKTILQLEQDRVFCRVEPEILAFLEGTPARFKTADQTLHKPLKDYRIFKSFKSKDDHANIQFTLMRQTADGSLAADIDIDEASGFRHGGEVLRNFLTGGKTNPYQIHQLLVLAELDPGYQLLLG